MSEQRILKWLKISYPSYCLTVQCVFLTKKIQSCQTIVDKDFRQSERKKCVTDVGSLGVAYFVIIKRNIKLTDRNLLCKLIQRRHKVRSF